MSRQKLTIGALSAQTGSNIPTIRYYEQIGLLPKPERAANGHRYYREADLKRLTFIRRCREFGFPIDQVRALVGLFDEGDQSCTDVRDMAQAHLDAVRVKLESLRQLETSLLEFVESCTEACNGGATRDCVIIGDLSEPGSNRTQDRQMQGCGGLSSNGPAGKMTVTELKRG
ncbi:MAG TPA: helix-turn-helix domain-containing protein [Noviherbaspirillum sp.]|jgi:DNA-binding transcriptional MerR regulator|uniref:MerR family transcriptional regulator n=1 Tax=Noviherbaspirillum sp. TaxID=1926288 RepID=UPI002DDDAEBB|nr:helix-turn-helix domain-containing protein [Noviherbaspirillum sp.]HEV2611689.1 helix-turn-helix domain-containing protein [Noviherbaspirillum sp.]